MSRSTNFRRPTASLADAGFDKRERVRAALVGSGVDRPPWMVWYHQPHTKSGSDLVNIAVDQLAGRLDVDVVKLMSDVRYPIPMQAIRQPNDWRLVDCWPDAANEFTMSYVHAVRRTRDLLGPAYPVIVTLYSPGMWAELMAGGLATVIEHFDADPIGLHNALANIAINLRRLASACIRAGADGIFLSLRGCDSTIPRAVYDEVMKPYDLIALQGAVDGWVNIVHVHGDSPDLRVEDALAYPAHAVSWATHTTGRSLASVRELTAKTVVGGFDHTASLLTGGADQSVELGSIDLWLEQARLAAAEAGPSLILAPGCSIPAGYELTAVDAMRAAIEQW